jgi:DNA sulfur modification protein DndD
MKVEKVIISNFKQYYGKNEVSLDVVDNKNVIVIGGKNGYGKTNFLIGLVWCLYGSIITEVDEIFRKEVRGNYPKFLKNSLNWDAQKEGMNSFYIEVFFSEVELNNNYETISNRLNSVIIRRKYNVKTIAEDLEILVDKKPHDFIHTKEEKVSFINDYIIPVKAAKFVFFDAEKISSIAELNLKEQGAIMNEALGKILGLEMYERLIDDLDNYRKGLKKDSASQDLHDQITSLENQRKIDSSRIEKFLNEIDDIEIDIERLDKEILECNQFLISHGAKTSTIDLKAMMKKKEDLSNQKSSLSNDLLDVIDYVPFLISAGYFQELAEYIKNEQEIQKKNYDNEYFKEKSTEFLEYLFNKPPLPDNDLLIKDKNFYVNKAEKLFEEIFLSEKYDRKIDFELDLSKSDIIQIMNVYNTIKTLSTDKFEYLFNEIIKIDGEVNEIDKIIKKAQEELEDDMVHEYNTKIKDLQREKDSKYKKIGENSNKKESLQIKVNKYFEKVKNLYDKVKIKKEKIQQLEKVTKYISAINDFIRNEKENKCISLEKNLLSELHSLLHKDFISKVEVKILPDNMGLEVILFDNKGNHLPQELLSAGEKQIYVSSLLKAILDESIKELPVFIDTPLGRLDKDHKENILKNYYPNLASQVIIFSTDDEITKRRLQLIKNINHKNYVLICENDKTTIKEGYFNYGS